ncbi:hypothetical protein Tco_0461561 [Tanacetum coccineum]
MAFGDDINKSGDDSNKKHDDIGFSSELNLSFGDTLYLYPYDTGGSPIDANSNRAIKPTATAFAAKTFDNKRRFNNNNNFNKGSSSNSNFNNRGPNPNMKCTNCNKIGHTVDKWFELIGYLVGYVKRNFNANTRTVSSNNASPYVHSNNASTDIRNNNSFASLSNEQISRLMSHLNDNGVSSTNDNMAGHPNGTQALITKIGDLKINNDITLYDVLVVLEYTVSLLSVHKVARDNK